MNRTMVAIIVVITVGLGIYGLSRLPNSQENSNTKQSEISFGTVQADVNAGVAYLYDVRTAEEFSEGFFANALNYDVQKIQTGQLPSINKDSKVYIYCRSGNRSSQAKALLEKAGFTNIIDLGGLSDVQAIGGTLTR